MAETVVTESLPTGAWRQGRGGGRRCGCRRAGGGRGRGCRRSRGCRRGRCHAGEVREAVAGQTVAAGENACAALAVFGADGATLGIVDALTEAADAGGVFLEDAIGTAGIVAETQALAVEADHTAGVDPVVSLDAVRIVAAFARSLADAVAADAAPFSAAGPAETIVAVLAGVAAIDAFAAHTLLARSAAAATGIGGYTGSRCFGLVIHRTTLRSVATTAFVGGEVDLADGIPERTAVRTGHGDRMTVDNESVILVPDGTCGRIKASAIAALVVTGQVSRTADLFLDSWSLLEDGGQANVPRCAAFPITALVLRKVVAAALQSADGARAADGLVAGAGAGANRAAEIAVRTLFLTGARRRRGGGWRRCGGRWRGRDGRTGAGGAGVGVIDRDRRCPESKQPPEQGSPGGSGAEQLGQGIEALVVHVHTPG